MPSNFNTNNQVDLDKELDFDVLISASTKEQIDAYRSNKCFGGCYGTRRLEVRLYLASYGVVLYCKKCRENSYSVRRDLSEKELFTLLAYY